MPFKSGKLWQLLKCKLNYCKASGVKMGINEVSTINGSYCCNWCRNWGIANPVLPDPVTGQRRRAIALQGRWVSWSKKAFEQFFLAKMRCGLSVPWFERWGLRSLGLSLVKPIENESSITHECSN